ncbi:50S ribosomal protein L24 [Patescibacteria group bacterium]|nr:50S ribosomal protein L24 [Patescibacteria group bacterium]
MKFKINDKVLVTAGKDKGKSGVIKKVYPKLNKILVEGANKYTKHIKPVSGRVGDKIKSERPFHTASIAIINDKGVADRVGFKIAKDGTKSRFFKKTGKVITEVALSKK